MDKVMIPNKYAGYYTKMMPKMMRNFEKMFRSASLSIENVIGKEKTGEVHAYARERFAVLASELPYVGGKKSPGTANLVGSAQILAIIWGLEKQGLAKEQIGEIIYHTFERYFGRIPGFIAKVMGLVMQGKWFREKRKKIAEESQKREFPEAFVSRVVTSTDGSFDSGLDILECAICKLYKRYDAAEFLPYICLGDYPMFRKLGVGFYRTKTIGNGGDFCDFRFKKGVKTQTGWPPDTLFEWKQGKPEDAV